MKEDQLPKSFAGLRGSNKAKKLHMGKKIGPANSIINASRR